MDKESRHSARRSDDHRAGTTSNDTSTRQEGRGTQTARKQIRASRLKYQEAQGSTSSLMPPPRRKTTIVNRQVLDAVANELPGTTTSGSTGRPREPSQVATASAGIPKQQAQNEKLQEKTRMSTVSNPNNNLVQNCKGYTKKNNTGPALHYQDEDIETINDDVPPPPDLVAFRREETRPGAVAVAGVGGRDDLLMEEGAVRPNRRNEGHQREESQVQLLNAVLVDPNEENPSSNVPFVHATSVEDENSGRKKRLYYTLGLVSCLVIIAVVVVVVVVVTGGNGSSAKRPENVANATVVIQLDDNSEETGWDLECAGFMFASVPPTAYAERDNALVMVATEVGLNEDCRYTIFDTGGNGITNGFFALYLGSDTNDSAALLAAGSGDFDNVQTVTFRPRAPV